MCLLCLLYKHKKLCRSTGNKKYNMLQRFPPTIKLEPASMPVAHLLNKFYVVLCAIHQLLMGEPT